MLLRNRLINDELVWEKNYYSENDWAREFYICNN